MKWYERARINRRIALDVEQRRIAKALHAKAERLRQDAPDLTIIDSVEIAAFQLGLQEAKRNDESPEDVHD